MNSKEAEKILKWLDKAERELMNQEQRAERELMNRGERSEWKEGARSAIAYLRIDLLIGNRVSENRPTNSDNEVLRMSVIGFSTDEAKDLAAEIRFRARVRRTDFALAFYSWEKRSEFRDLDLSCEEELENQIDCLVHRLYLANQLAFAVNYDHDKTEIVIQNPQNLKGGKVKDDMKYLYQQLSSWEYNLYTNAGRCFISDDDLETVERIKKHLLEKYSDIWGESSRPIYEGD